MGAGGASQLLRLLTHSSFPELWREEGRICFYHHLCCAVWCTAQVGIQLWSKAYMGHKLAMDAKCISGSWRGNILGPSLYFCSFLLSCKELDVFPFAGGCSVRWGNCIRQSLLSTILSTSPVLEHCCNCSKSLAIDFCNQIFGLSSGLAFGNLLPDDRPCLRKGLEAQNLDSNLNPPA